MRTLRWSHRGPFPRFQCSVPSAGHAAIASLAVQSQVIGSKRLPGPQATIASIESGFRGPCRRVVRIKVAWRRDRPQMRLFSRSGRQPERCPSLKLRVVGSVGAAGGGVHEGT